MFLSNMLRETFIGLSASWIPSQSLQRGLKNIQMKSQTAIYLSDHKYT